MSAYVDPLLHPPVLSLSGAPTVYSQKLKHVSCLRESVWKNPTRVLARIRAFRKVILETTTLGSTYLRMLVQVYDLIPTVSRSSLHVAIDLLRFTPGSGNVTTFGASDRNNSANDATQFVNL